MGGNHLPLSGAFDGEGLWEGPDDLDGDDDSFLDPAPVPELVVTKQWGLVLPDGQIAWDSWQGIPFSNPLDRLHMVSKLQATANDVGWNQDDFLSRYSWATRNQIARVLYQDTGFYGLIDSAVSHEDTATPEESGTP